MSDGDYIPRDDADNEQRSFDSSAATAEVERLLKQGEDIIKVVKGVPPVAVCGIGLAVTIYGVYRYASEDKRA